MSAAALSSGAGTLTTLREVDEACRGSASTAGAGFDVEGKLIGYFRRQGDRLWAFTVSDGTNQVTIYEIPFPEKAKTDFDVPHLNDTVRLAGKLYEYEGKTCAGYLHATRLRPGDPESIPTISAEEVNAPDPGLETVRVKGTVRDASRDETDPNFIYMTLNSDGSLVHAMVHNFDDASIVPVSLIGRNVTLCGTVCTPSHQAHRYSGRYIAVSGFANVHIGEYAGSADGAAPDISSIGHIPPQDIARLGRHRAAGTVRAVWRGDRFLMETDNGETVFVKSLSGALPACGSRVSATGFPETDTFFLHLDNATWSACDGDPLPDEEPQDVSIDALCKNRRGVPHVNVDFNGKTIRFAGHVRFRSPGDGRMLQVESEGHLVTVDLSPLANGAPDAELGAKVSVTGVYVIDGERTSFGDNVPHARGFFVVPRSADDFTVLSHPPWLTPGRMAFSLAVLLAVIAAIGTWNIALAKRAESRGRQLADEHLGRMASELKAAERTNLAVELHDALSQTLAGISLAVGAAGEHAPHDRPELVRYLNFASNAIDACRTELKNCLWDLRSKALDEGDMEKAVRMTIQQDLGGDRISIRFAVPRGKLSDRAAHDVLRTIRELAANAVRHGHAEHVSVAGCIEGGRLLFSVKDDGCGFDPASAPGVGQGHFGLQGIRERIKRYGGTVEIESAPGKGCKATVVLELECLQPPDGIPGSTKSEV